MLPSLFAYTSFKGWDADRLHSSNDNTQFCYKPEITIKYEACFKS